MEFLNIAEGSPYYDSMVYSEYKKCKKNMSQTVEYHLSFLILQATVGYSKLL